MRGRRECAVSAVSVDEILGPITRLVTAVQSAPLTHAALWERWGKPSERNFQRMREELGLLPFVGRGETAMYRMAAVLRAEERGERKKGGALS